jgi:hypothetical protein
MNLAGCEMIILRQKYLLKKKQKKENSGKRANNLFRDVLITGLAD